MNIREKFQKSLFVSKNSLAQTEEERLQNSYVEGNDALEENEGDENPFMQRDEGSNTAQTQRINGKLILKANKSSENKMKLNNPGVREKTQQDNSMSLKNPKPKQQPTTKSNTGTSTNNSRKVKNQNEIGEKSQSKVESVSESFENDSKKAVNQIKRKDENNELNIDKMPKTSTRTNSHQSSTKFSNEISSKSQSSVKMEEEKIKNKKINNKNERESIDKLNTQKNQSLEKFESKNNNQQTHQKPPLMSYNYNRSKEREEYLFPSFVDYFILIILIY